MEMREWVERLMGLGPEWRIERVDEDSERQEARVTLARRAGSPLRCPECGRTCPGYDVRRREWRGLDAWGYKTFVVYDVPRVECPEHGVTTTRVPWAEGRSRYTAAFESLVIDWLREASVLAVSRRLRLSWTAVAGIMERAVRRGLARREMQAPRRLSVDETSFKRGHKYVTVVSDAETKDVLHVAPGRSREALEAFYRKMGERRLAAVESVSMDMWRPYVAATEAWVADARSKTAFDRFHVAKHLGDAVDKVRRAEHKELKARGNAVLAGTRYQWLRGAGKKTHAEKLAFAELRKSVERTSQAWALKEAASKLWRYRSRGWAHSAWLRWLQWASASGLEPVEKAAAMVRTHLWGIVNAVVLDATNGPAEGVNSRIQAIKARCRGFRNQDRFAAAILFHLGGLDLCPRPAQH